MSLDTAITPVTIPSVRVPVAVDICPGGEVISLHHISNTSQVVNEVVLVSNRRRLDGRLSNDLGLGGELDIFQDIRVESLSYAIAGRSDVEADVVVEDGET